jgi:hypothetical protein
LVVSKVGGAEAERERRLEEKQSQIDSLVGGHVDESSDEDEPRSKRLKAADEPKVSLLDEHSEFKRRLEGFLLLMLI